MREMCDRTGQRHWRDVCSNRNKAWERCVVQLKRGMGEMCSPIGERDGRDVWSNRREAWERFVVQQE